MAGLGDYLETVMGSPLFLGGAALASGEGFGGAMQGMKAGNQFREEARKRQQQEQMRTLAQQMASDPKSGINPTLAQLFTVQPELAGQYLIKHPEMELERAKAKASIAASEAQTKAALAGIGAPERLARLQMELKDQGEAKAIQRRIDTLTSAGIDPSSPEGRQYRLTGEFKPEDPLVKYKDDEGIYNRRTGQVLRETKPKPPDSTARKAVYEAQDELPNIKAAIEAFDEMKSLVPQAYHGFGSTTRSRINEGLPSWMPNVVSDPNKAKATNRLDVLMSEQAISAMSQALKGATTDTEMMAFRSMLANPNISPENKLKAIETMRLRAQRHYSTKVDRIRELGGELQDFAKPNLKSKYGLE